MKNKIIITAITAIAVLTAYKLITNHQEQERQTQIQNYTTCIKQQAETQGYIIRSQCSYNYQALDQLSGLTYTTKNNNLYLNK